ncbi:hypothetical protein [Psychrobacillus sp.]|nr:hypothetical protein [Psychrobacillus sp.]
MKKWALKFVIVGYVLIAGVFVALPHSTLQADVISPYMNEPQHPRI